MGRPCTVCTHPQRLAIDQALVNGRSTYDLAALYDLSPDALSRHFAAHVPADLKKARQDEDKEHALDIVKQLKAINIATLTVLNDARLAGNPDLVLRAADRVQRQLELQAKLLGELDERPRLNVILTPE
jgi:transposase